MMKEIGRQTALSMLLTSIGVLLLQLSAVQAQETVLSATVSENQVFVGEQFSLTIEIRGETLRNVELPMLPVFTGIRVLSSSPSRGQSISIVNGRANTSTTYRYTLIAQQEGSHQIPPITVTIDGEERTTDPITVEVLQSGAIQPDSDHRMPDIFSVIELDDESPVVGQQLVASLVIYFREGVEVTSYQPTPGWRTDGFWKEELENVDQPRAESEIIGNVRYRKATLLRYALFPSRSGTLTLSPFELHLGIRSQPRRNDPFGSVFGGFGTNQQRVTVESEPVEVSVGRIHSPPRGDVIGAVGSFEITRTASTTRARVGESIEITTRIEGAGNIPLISRPEYIIPESFESYQPQEVTDISRRGTTINGTKVYRDIIIPRSPGTFTLAETIIAVYNPEIRAHEYQMLHPITLEISRDAGSDLAEFAGNNFSMQPISGLAVWYERDHRPITDRKWIWIGYLIPLLALLIGYRQKRLSDRLQADSDFARSHYAWDRAQNLIKKAKSEVGQDTSRNCYHTLHKAVTGFITDRLSLPAAGQSDVEIRERISRETDDSGIHKLLKQTLDKCATISYAPAESDQDVMNDIRKAEELLKKLREIL